jgi:hypothetical protein
MIKIEHIYTCNWEAAIRGMRNPLNSWEKSDSGYGCFGKDNGENGRTCLDCNFNPSWCGCNSEHYILGPNDLKLAKQLATAGSDHGKFLRQIIFSCDITAPMYWWKEMDTYKVGTVRNSCSTMHKIMSKEFEINDFSFENMNDSAHISMANTIGYLNELRNAYTNGDYSEESKKMIWYSIIQILPSSYNQKATWTANYEVLRNIYHARKNHKLDEWHVFCDMIEKLPYSELITEERK